MAAELAEATAVVARSDARAVVLVAEGPDFSYGGDIMDWPDTDVLALRSRFELYMSAFDQFERLPLPVIAAVHGLCSVAGSSSYSAPM